MLTIHALRTGKDVIMPEEEFTCLMQQILTIQPVNLIERALDDVETEEDRKVYRDAIQEFERGESVAFETVKSFWLQGNPAHV